METKSFPTLGVAGVFTGYVLEERGMVAIHEVMDHLFPGIMTIGVAAMQETASKALAEQLPQLKALGTVVEGKWQEYAKRALVELGPTLPVSGPLSVSDGAVDAAFEKFARRS